MVTTGTDVFTPQFSIEGLRLLVEQAHAAGLPVTADAHAAAASTRPSQSAWKVSNTRRT
jgi:hypothetical protein